MSPRLGQYGTLLVTYLRPQWVRVVVLTVVLLCAANSYGKKSDGLTL